QRAVRADSAHLLSSCDLDGRARDERSPVAEQEGRQLRDLGGPAEPPERNRSGQLGFGDAAVVELLLQHGGVRISPGQIEFARTPWAPKSLARLRVSETTAAFELLYAMCPPAGCSPHCEAILTMAAESASLRRGSAARHRRMTASTLTA